MVLPTEMNAVGLVKTGDSPDVIQEFRLPVPTSGPNQILVKASHSRPGLFQYHTILTRPRHA